MRIVLNINEKYIFLSYFSLKFLKLAQNLSLLDPFFLFCEIMIVNQNFWETVDAEMKE